MAKKIKSSTETVTFVDQFGTTVTVPKSKPAKKSMAQLVAEHNPKSKQETVIEVETTADLSTTSNDEIAKQVEAKTPNPTRRIKKPEPTPVVKGPTKKELDAKIAKAAKKREVSGKSLADLCKEHGIQGRVARRALRAASKSGKLKHDHGHGWTFQDDALDAAIEILTALKSGGTTKRAASQKPKKIAKTEATPPKNPLRKKTPIETDQIPETKAIEPLTKQEKNRVGKAIAEAIKSYQEKNEIDSNDSSDWDQAVQDDCIGAIVAENGLETMSVVAKAEVARFRQQPMKVQSELVAQLVAG